MKNFLFSFSKSEGTTFLTQPHPHVDEFFSNRSVGSSADKLPAIATTHII
jgi:hypothetical protein